MCSCKEFSYILQDRPEDRDLDVIVSVTYHSKQPLKHLWEGTHVTGRSVGRSVTVRLAGADGIVEGGRRSAWGIMTSKRRVAGAVLGAL